MGDLALQTSVEPAGEGSYRAIVHQDWEIWGPCGGYVAAIALRAAGAESPFARPASFFCHYLSVAAFACRWTSWSRRCGPGARCWPSESK